MQPALSLLCSTRSQPNYDINPANLFIFSRAAPGRAYRRMCPNGKLLQSRWCCRVLNCNRAVFFCQRILLREVVVSSAYKLQKLVFILVPALADDFNFFSNYFPAFERWNVFLSSHSSPANHWAHAFPPPYLPVCITLAFFLSPCQLLFLIFSSLFY